MHPYSISSKVRLAQNGGRREIDFTPISAIVFLY